MDFCRIFDDGRLSTGHSTKTANHYFIFTVRKAIFSFSKCSEKMTFPKKLHWNMIFLVSSRKMIFLFPENMILFFRRKMNDDLSQKKTKKKAIEIWYILQIFWKDGLSKKIALEYDLSYIIRKDGISFSRKYYIFFYRRKMKDDLSQKIHGNMMSLYVGKGGISFSYKNDITLLSKKQRWSFSKKIHVKMSFPALLKKMTFIIEKKILAFWIDILERVPMILCTFMETFLSVFIYCFPIKKPQEIWSIGLKFDFICKLYGWRYSTIKNLW